MGKERNEKRVYDIEYVSTYGKSGTIRYAILIFLYKSINLGETY